MGRGGRQRKSTGVGGRRERVSGAQANLFFIYFVF